MCWSREHIRNCTGAEGVDYTWNEKLFLELHVDSICLLLVSLNAVKRTQLLMEYNMCKQCYCSSTPFWGTVSIFHLEA